MVLIIKLFLLKKILDFSVAQIINEKENKKMASKTSLDEKLLIYRICYRSYKISEKIKLNFNFLLDQNYKRLIIMNLGGIDFDPMKI